jgi:hypothetical protein
MIPDNPVIVKFFTIRKSWRIVIDALYPTEYIYSLSDPRDQSVRYVGRTTDVKMRYIAHLRASGNPEKDEWTQELLALQMKPLMTVLETLKHGCGINSGEREAHWIRHFQDAGAELYNRTHRKEKRHPIIFATEETQSHSLLEEISTLRAENAQLRAIIQQISKLTKEVR